MHRSRGKKGEILMSNRTHHYDVTIRWTGNTGSGTSGYRNYTRDHEIASGPGEPPILGSSDAAFRGDSTRWNPEELLVASLSACHKLWYLHLCAEAGVIVTQYFDQAEGVMEESTDGSGKFRKVTLGPNVVIATGSDCGQGTRFARGSSRQVLHCELGKFPCRTRMYRDARLSLRLGG